jgi:hypothetical protein
MRLSLLPHPDTPSASVKNVEVEARRSANDELSVLYRVHGAVGALRLPSIEAPRRAEDLWRTTCFEAFVRPAGGDAYWEFNFAPSAAWAAYGLSNYRVGLEPALEVSEPMFVDRVAPDLYELDVTVDLGRLPALRGARMWEVALSVVIEDRAGDIAYWALAHPPGKPDFHHPVGFALDLPPAD